MPYSTSETARLSGLSFRQIDYWDREGVFHPTWPSNGSGSARRYSDEDVVALWTMRRFIDDCGVSIRRAALVAQALRGGVSGGAVVVLAGDQVLVTSDPDDVIEMMLDAGCVQAVATPTLADVEEEAACG